MKVTGHDLRNALVFWNLDKDAAIGSFNDSLTKFPGEEKTHPTKLAEDFVKAETAIVLIQEAQSRYNLMVEIKVGSDTMTLCKGVKLLGGLSRIAKLWKATVKPAAQNPYLTTTRRSTEEIVAHYTMTRDEFMKEAQSSTKTVTDLVSAISRGNATEVDITALRLDPELLRK